MFSALVIPVHQFKDIDCEFLIDFFSSDFPCMPNLTISGDASQSMNSEYEKNYKVVMRESSFRHDHTCFWFTHSFHCILFPQEHQCH